MNAAQQSNNSQNCEKYCLKVNISYDISSDKNNKIDIHYYKYFVQRQRHKKQLICHMTKIFCIQFSTLIFHIFHNNCTAFQLHLVRINLNGNFECKKNLLRHNRTLKKSDKNWKRICLFKVEMSANRFLFYECKMKKD